MVEAEAVRAEAGDPEGRSGEPAFRGIGDGDDRSQELARAATLTRSCQEWTAHTSFSFYPRSSSFPRDGQRLDGARLHELVPPSRWCVSRGDLLDFHRIASLAVRQGSIVPTSADSFDPRDRYRGPAIYTVTEQLIRPVTAACGCASWALMLHPEGLECDLFVTHCWAEGVFEFLDKVMHSWPRLAKHAYCCMLSNPQNLDIGSLISHPANSPFAQALQSARCMLVVPNSACSVYTRIWCVYEAFLSHTWNKPIFTATTPVRGLWCRVAGAFGVCAISFLVSSLALHRHRIEADPSLVVWILVCFSLVAIGSLWLQGSFRLRALNFVGSFLAGIMMGFSLHVARSGHLEGVFQIIRPQASVVCYFFAGLFFALREADRLWDAQAAQEAKQLLRGFTGKVQDAKSSVSTDRERILGEIRSSEVEAAVEKVISVLIDAGMSTPALRFASHQGVDISGAGRWSLAQVTIVFILFLAHPLLHARLDSSCRGWLVWVPWLKFLQGLAWLILFKLLEPDQRGFAAAAGAKLGALPFYIVYLTFILIHHFGAPETSGVLHGSCLADISGSFIWGPLMLGASILGVKGCVGIPVIGTTMVNLLLSSGTNRRNNDFEALSHDESSDESSCETSSFQEASGESDEDGASIADGRSPRDVLAAVTAAVLAAEALSPLNQGIGLGRSSAASSPSGESLNSKSLLGTV